MKTIKKLMAYVAIMAIALTSSCVNDNQGPTPPKNTEFAVGITIDGDWVNITVTPKNVEQYYFNYIMEESIFEKQYGGNASVAVSSDIEKIIGEYVDGWGGTREEALSQMLVKGEGTQSFPIFGNKTYYCYVVYVDMQTGKMIGEPELTPFNSTKVEPSDNTFEIAILDTQLMGFKYSVTPSNEDTYCCNYIKVSEYESTYSSLTEYADALVNMFGIYNSAYSGYGEYEVGYLEPETEYMVIAFGWEHGVRTTEPASVNVTTKPKGDPSKCSFEIDIKSTNAFGLEYTITPSDSTVSYYYDIVLGDQTAEQVEETLYKLLDEQIATGWPSGYAEYFQIWATYGQASDTTNVAIAGAEYKVYAVAVDTETGEFAGDIYFSEVCKTPEHVMSDLTINISIDKYFDGTELAEAYPNVYAGWCEGLALFLPTVTFENGEPQQYYIQLYEYEEGYEEKSDEWAIYALLTNGYPYITEFVMPWETDGYLLGVALDADGKFSKVFRQKVNLTKEGASPASEHPYYSSNGASIQKSSKSKGLAVPFAAKQKQKLSTIR